MAHFAPSLPSPGPPPSAPSAAPGVSRDHAPAASPYLNVVVEGCCHGALDQIYASVGQIERRRGVKVDLLLVCGDFQALRNEDDFEALAVPPKYRAMESFYK